jgi:hypothetical protein
MFSYYVNGAGWPVSCSVLRSSFARCIAMMFAPKPSFPLFRMKRDDTGGILRNEYDQIGRDSYLEACVDAPGVNRAELHEYIGSAALRFFDSHLKVRQRKAP